MPPEKRIMSWKFVFNGNVFKNYREASIAAKKAGYKFLLYNDAVYFLDGIYLHILDTGLREKDLIG